MRQKAVLIDFRNIKSINAETVVSRHFDLKAVQEQLSQVQDVDSWQIPPEGIRPTQNWSTEWGPAQDTKLLVGVWRYGIGAWEQIQADPSLHLAGKFFLEEQKAVKPLPAVKMVDGESPAEGVTPPVTATPTKMIPNAVHLVRRADYLSGLIREQAELAKAYAEHQSKPGPQMPSNLRHGEASSSRKSSKAPAAAHDAKNKRKATPEFTDSSDSD
jgi:chromodomain-helicase-DNA-binding protein 1